MAEGLLRGMAVDRSEVFRAGTESARVGSETLDRYLKEPLDLVITVCDDANEAPPVFPGARGRLHWSFPEPSKAAGSRQERLRMFRNVRDEIRAHIEDELAKSGV